MNRLGISVYPDLRPLDEIKDYLKLASTYGCTRVFSSMFNVEGTNEEVLSYFKDLIDASHEVGIEVSLDVNPECLERLGASPNDLSVFKDINVDVLRMDISFGLEKDMQLVQNPYGILIEFNASIIPAETLKEMIDQGADSNNILVCHNFYPQRYTGMKWEKFKEVSKLLKELGVRVGAFISSNAKDTHGVWGAERGLCTVERHRGQPIDLQLRELLLTNSIDDILIGNAYATEDEFKMIQEVFTVIEPDEEKYPIVKMKKMYGASDDSFYPQRKIRVNLCEDITEIEKEILFDFFPHSDVGDSSEWIWRSRMPRFLYQDKEIKPRSYNKKMIDRGSVVMVNDNYKHYAGEVQVVLFPIENDGDRNLIGYLDQRELEMLEMIPEREIVVFLDNL